MSIAPLAWPACKNHCVPLKIFLLCGRQLWMHCIEDHIRIELLIIRNKRRHVVSKAHRELSRFSAIISICMGVRAVD